MKLQELKNLLVSDYRINDIDHKYPDYLAVTYQPQPDTIGFKESDTAFTMDKIKELYNMNYISEVLRYYWCLEHIKPESDLLVYGCGYREIEAMAYTFRYGLKSITSIDGLDINRQRYKMFGRKTSLYIQGDFETQRQYLNGAGVFDTIIFTEVLEHLTRESGRIILQECSRLLKQGGHFIFSAPIAETNIDGSIKNDIGSVGHIHCWDINELIDYLSRLFKIKFMFKSLPLGKRNFSKLSINNKDELLHMKNNLDSKGFPKIWRSVLAGFMMDGDLTINDGSTLYCLGEKI